MRYSFTKVSGNSKTGPMPVTLTEKASCPDSCPLKNNGCYASAGRLNIHWNKGMKLSLSQLTANIAALPPGKLWRHNVAGDFILENERIDRRAMVQIVKANTGRKGFGYTHAQPQVGSNATLIKYANQNGFALNLSADSLVEADKLAALNIAPVVTILPAGQTENTTTPAGRKVVVCPNYKNPNIQCIDCGLCQKQRSAIVGFPAHGIQLTKVNAVFNQTN